MSNVHYLPLTEDLLDHLEDDEQVSTFDLIEIDNHTLQMDQAGVDQLTAVDTFMGINGDKVFIVGDEYDDEN